MRQWRRLVVVAAVTSAFVVLFFPNTLALVERAGDAAIRQLVPAVRNPAAQPILLGIVLLALLVISFLAIFAIVRVFTSVGFKSGGRLARLYDRFSPESPRTKGMMFMLAFTVVFFVGVATFVPWFASTLTDDDIDRVFSDVEQGEYGGDLRDLFADDAVAPDGPTVAYREAGVDSDGDGLRDEWERNGQTPGGQSLPGADPFRADLYVQINYGENVTALTDAELDRLREIWASMPVDNPDGSTGIDLHLAVGPPGSGTLGGPAVADGKSDVDRFYTRTNLGGRYCVYHQVVLGDIAADDIGYAEAPGRAVVLDSRPFTDYEGDAPFRAAMITHALLHTIVGEVDGSAHSDGGWLDYPSADNERLSDAVANKLSEEGFATTQAYRNQCGERPDSAR